MTPTPIALGPTRTPLLEKAITAAGGEPAELDRARALIWNGGPAGFPDRLPAGIEWVQLFSAGVEEWFGTPVFDCHRDVVFTSAAGAFAHSVAEHTLMLLLAGVRQLPAHLAARGWRHKELAPRMGTLRGATVAVVGAGGIGRELIDMLAPLGARVIAVNRSGAPIDRPGVVETVPADRLSEIWSRVDHVVVAAPATRETRHLIGRAELARLQPTSWVINIARGSLVDTDALVEALRAGTIAGAGLDVTDPEPLPDGHPLWDLPNAMVTPHDSNPHQLRSVAFAEHVTENVSRFVQGRELLARIDVAAGY
ncbi:phosphoglycerate dehydrogenase-like enzyme [Nocardia sp. GAS34]|uniref:D-isomer specific 2-hydroxyacid dehydrogenase family protein n=1 Tax=unclassified Nocardia TaxID=2637762 RepID=UPI003D22CAE0